MNECPSCGPRSGAVFAAERLRFALVFGPGVSDLDVHERTARERAAQVFHPFAFTLECDQEPTDNGRGLWQSTWDAEVVWDDDESKPKLAGEPEIAEEVERFLQQT